MLYGIYKDACPLAVNRGEWVAFEKAENISALAAKYPDRSFWVDHGYVSLSAEDVERINEMFRIEKKRILKLQFQLVRNH